MDLPVEYKIEVTKVNVNIDFRVILSGEWVNGHPLLTNLLIFEGLDREHKRRFIHTKFFVSRLAHEYTKHVSWVLGL